MPGLLAVLHPCRQAGGLPQSTAMPGEPGALACPPACTRAPPWATSLSVLSEGCFASVPQRSVGPATPARGSVSWRKPQPKAVTGAGGAPGTGLSRAPIFGEGRFYLSSGSGGAPRRLARQRGWELHAKSRSVPWAKGARRLPGVDKWHWHTAHHDQSCSGPLLGLPFEFCVLGAAPLGKAMWLLLTPSLSGTTLG